MKRAAAILIAIIALSACTTTKEQRRSNRAAKKLEKLVLKYPELIKRDTILIPITLRTPAIEGVLSGTLKPITLKPNREFKTPINLSSEKPAQAPGHEKPESMRGVFEDDSLKLDITLFSNGATKIKYQIKPMKAEGEAKHVSNKIQPVQYKPMPMKWWQNAAQTLGLLFLILIIIFITAWILRSKIPRI